MKRRDLVIIFNGNHMVLPVLEEERERYHQALLEAKEKRHEIVVFGNPRLEDSYTLMAGPVLGWYFREPNDALVRQVKAVEKIAEGVSRASDEGEEWRKG